MLAVQILLPTKPISPTCSHNLEIAYGDTTPPVSPPTLPRLLEDQIHKAYALNNIHLTKILYLRLQGVHIVDNSNPRIKQVREEDFPFGTLILDEEDERTLKECQRIERYQKRDQRRADKREWAWDQSTVGYRQQCLPVQQHK